MDNNFTENCHQNNPKIQNKRFVSALVTSTDSIEFILHMNVSHKNRLSVSGEYPLKCYKLVTKGPAVLQNAHLN